jgi:hypothetical protein
MFMTNKLVLHKQTTHKNAEYWFHKIRHNQNDATQLKEQACDAYLASKLKQYMKTKQNNNQRNKNLCNKKYKWYQLQTLAINS